MSTQEKHDRMMMIDHLMKKAKKAARTAVAKGVFKAEAVPEYLDKKRAQLEAKETTELRNLAMRGPARN